jgi:hypothetical protein
MDLSLSWILKCCSVHGVRRTPSTPSDFEDDEYVVFSTNQQRQEYLVEFKLSEVPKPAPLYLASKVTAPPPTLGDPLTQVSRRVFIMADG